MYESVEKLASQMRMMGIYHNVQRRCIEADKNSLHPAEFLKLILEDESLARKNAKAKCLTTRARFRTQCDLQNWDNTTKRGITLAKFKELASCHFEKRKENLIITGATGVGKTHLAIALGRQLCLNEVSVMFQSVNLFFEQVQAEKAAGRYLAYLKKLTRVNVIVFDDFGLRSYSHGEAQTLLEVLEERYSIATSIFTSQVSPSGWDVLFEDAVIGEAIIDRIVNPSEIVTLKGDSYRKKSAQSLTKN